MSKSTSNEGEGGDALIHLRVSPALKGRWVRESRAAGMKLTDWIIQRVEARPMNVYKIPDTLSSAYHGAGYALAAIAGGRPVALRYVEDLAPDLGDVLAEGGSAARRAVQNWVASDAAGPTVRELQALGDVSVGMCSSWEFVEL